MIYLLVCCCSIWLLLVGLGVSWCCNSVCSSEWRKKRLNLDMQITGWNAHHKYLWWDNFDGSILFLFVQKIMLYFSGAVACGWIPCKRAERFCSLWMWQDKFTCILRSTKCHLSLQLHPFCCLFFYCVALIKKKKKWMHEKRKWCHQSNRFASKGKDSTYNPKGHKNILKGNWAPFVEILWYIPLTCPVLLRNNAYRQRHILAFVQCQKLQLSQCTASS